MADLIEFVLEFLLGWRFYLAFWLLGGAALIYFLLEPLGFAVRLAVATVYAVSMTVCLQRRWRLFTKDFESEFDR
jgi:hypothetical protein